MKKQSPWFLTENEKEKIRAMYNEDNDERCSTLKIAQTLNLNHLTVRGYCGLIKYQTNPDLKSFWEVKKEKINKMYLAGNSTNFIHARLNITQYILAMYLMENFGNIRLEFDKTIKLTDKQIQKAQYLFDRGYKKTPVAEVIGVPIKEFTTLIKDNNLNYNPGTYTAWNEDEENKLRLLVAERKYTLKELATIMDFPFTFIRRKVKAMVILPFGTCWSDNKKENNMLLTRFVEKNMSNFEIAMFMGFPEYTILKAKRDLGLTKDIIR